MKHVQRNLKVLLALACLFFYTTPLRAVNYYWVGGSGNWNDINHWATTSGGGVLHSVIPSAFDDVFFDANSGFAGGNNTVTINVAADCRSMTWTGGWATNPTLSGNQVLNIYGNLNLHSAMNLTFNGNLEFEATTSGWNINLADHLLTSDIFMKGIGGSWDFQDSVLTTGDFELLHGTVTTNHYTLRCNGFNSYNSNARTINFGSSAVRIYYRVYLNGTNLSWNYGTSSFYFYASNGNIPVGGQTLGFYNLYTVPSTGQFTADKGILVANQAVFNNDARLNHGTNSFANFTFTSGHTYTFASGGTHTVTGSFMQAGSPGCSHISRFLSTSLGQQATLLKPAGNVTLSFISIQDILATGGATFTINNAVNMGNNSGWVLNAIPPRILYWVGGSGNWNDINHWSVSSGGIGGECVPNFQDDVFFDGNSGFTGGNNTVTINAASDCRSMTWSGGWSTNPVFAGNQVLNIYGNLNLHSNMTVSFNGNLEFEATTSGWNINLADHLLTSDIFMKGIGGGWDFQDSVLTTGDFELLHGSVTTNHYTLRCNGFNSYNSNARTINFGSSVVRIYYRVYLNGTNLNWNYGTSSFYFYASNGNIPVGGQTLSFYNLYTVPSSGQFTADKSLNVTNNLGFNNDARFNGATNTVNHVSFAAGKTYTFASAGNTTITGTVSQSGLPGCATITKFQAASLGQTSTLTKTTGNVTLIYASIQDLVATGGATFTVNNGINMGNNSGWIINVSAPLNLYWVGGAGNWNDPAHWSLTSGGSGGACVPSFQDDVFFDANSGFSGGSNIVTLNIVGDCRSMTWSGGWSTNPVFAGNQVLNIYGNLNLHSAMNLTFNGNLEFEATTSGWNINLADHLLTSDIFVKGIGGSWDFQDSVLTTGDFELLHGTVTTNHYTLRCNGFNSYNSNVRTINFGSSAVRIYYRVYLNGTNLNWNYGTSSFYFYASNGNIPVGGQTLSFYNLYTVPSTGVFVADKSLHVINQALFNNSARFNGPANTFEHITVTAGKTYTFPGSGITNILGSYTGKGNPCNVITLNSTTPGVFSLLFIPVNDTLVTDYCTIQDLNATGGTYYAGAASADYGNNVGWIFANSPGYIFGLGNNMVINCNQLPYLLSTQNFNTSNTTTYLWNDGSTGSTFLAPDSGTYYVDVTYGVNCTVRDSIHIAVQGGNLQLSVQDTTVCGTEGLTLTVQSNGNVTWYDMNANALNTGTTHNTGQLPGTISYVVVAVNPNGCPGQVSDTVTVTVNPLPMVGLNPVPNLCADAAPVSLIISPQGGILFGAGISNGIFDPAAAGVGTHVITYSYTDGNGCQADTQQVVTVYALPVVSFNALADVCLNGPAVPLTGGVPSGGQYSGTGVINNQFDPTLAGIGQHTVQYVFTDGNGCSNTATQTITVNTQPVVSLTAFSSLCVSGAVLNLSGGSPMGGQYSGTGVMNNQFDPAAAGIGVHTIQYVYTNGNGCSDTAVQTLEVKSCLGTEENPDVTFQVFPNPASEWIQVVFSGTTLFQVEIMDMTGKIWMQKEMLAPEKISVAHLPSGMYMIRSIGGNEKFTVIH